MSITCDQPPPQSLGPWPDGTGCYRRPHGSDVPHVAPGFYDWRDDDTELRELVWFDDAYQAGGVVVEVPVRPDTAYRPQLWPGALAPAWPQLPAIRRRPRLLVEMAVLAGFLFVWQWAVFLTGRLHEHPYAHGRLLWSIERAMHLPVETLLRDGWRPLSWYYLLAHTFGTLAFLGWAWWRGGGYLRLRRALLVATVASFLLALWQVASPNAIGYFSDVANPLLLAASNAHVYDVFSAFPSLHVVWAALIAFAAWQHPRTRWVAVHLPLTVYVVIAQGHHYWLDCAAGIAVAWAAWRIAGATGARRGATC